MRNRLADLLWLCGATLCRWAANVETRDYPPAPPMGGRVMQAICEAHGQISAESITAPVSVLDRPARPRCGEWARLRASDAPVFIPSVDGVTKPWLDAGSSRLQ